METPGTKLIGLCAQEVAHWQRELNRAIEEELDSRMRDRILVLNARIRDLEAEVRALREIPHPPATDPEPAPAEVTVAFEPPAVVAPAAAPKATAHRTVQYSAGALTQCLLELARNGARSIDEYHAGSRTTRKSVSIHLGRLVAQGLLRRVGSGRYATAAAVAGTEVPEPVPVPAITRLYQHLREHEGETLALTDLVEVCGLGRDATRSALSKLAARGLAVRVGRGHFQCALGNRGGTKRHKGGKA